RHPANRLGETVGGHEPVRPQPPGPGRPGCRHEPVTLADATDDTESRTMRMLFISNVFPNPYQPQKGVFNLYMLRALSREHAVRVVSAISWLDDLQARRQGKGPIGPGRRAAVGGFACDFPRFYYPPKLFRALYGQFLWLSTRVPIRRLLREWRPDAVLGYWA